MSDSMKGLKERLQEHEERRQEYKKEREKINQEIEKMNQEMEEQKRLASLTAGVMVIVGAVYLALAALGVIGMSLSGVLTGVMEYVAVVLTLLVLSVFVVPVVGFLCVAVLGRGE